MVCLLEGGDQYKIHYMKLRVVHEIDLIPVGANLFALTNKGVVGLVLA